MHLEGAATPTRASACGATPPSAQPAVTAQAMPITTLVGSPVRRGYMPQVFHCCSFLHNLHAHTKAQAMPSQLNVGMVQTAPARSSSPPPATALIFIVAWGIMGFKASHFMRRACVTSPAVPSSALNRSFSPTPVAKASTSSTVFMEESSFGGSFTAIAAPARTALPVGTMPVMAVALGAKPCVEMR
eukprot:1754211-Amphidinium_carterae.1